jgi:MFS family permease
MKIELESKTRRSPFHAFREPFIRSRQFPLLWLGQFISMLGSSVTTVILPIVVYSLTGSAAAMGLMMAMYMLPNVLMLPLSGWLVDRYDRLGLMLLSDVVRFLVLLALAACFWGDLLSIPVLYALVAVYGLMDGLFQPAYSAVRAGVFTPDIRNAANALTQLGNQGVRLIGPAVGGMLVSFLSAGFGFGLDALTYLLSFFCLLALRKRLPRKKAETGPGRSWKADLLEGVNVLRSHSWLWITILVFAFINICFHGLFVVMVPWLFKIHFGFEPYVYGLGVTCSGAGAILAAVLFGMRKKWRRRGLIAYGGTFTGGLALLLMPFTPWPAGLGILLALHGFGVMVFALIWETSLQELVPEEAFGRVVSLDLLGSWVLLPLGYISVGWLADLIGGIETMVLFAGMGLVTVLGAVLLPSIRRFD